MPLDSKKTVRAIPKPNNRKETLIFKMPIESQETRYCIINPPENKVK